MSSKYKEILSIIIIPVFSYCFYLCAYLFMMGYYFHNESISFESFLFQVPFDFKTLVFLGVTLMTIVVFLITIIDRILESQETKEVFSQLLSWLFFIMILSVFILGFSYFIFHIPLTSEFMGDYLIFTTFITLVAQMRIKRLRVFTDLALSAIISSIMLVNLLILNFYVESDGFIAIIFTTYIFIIFIDVKIRFMITKYMIFNAFSVLTIVGVFSDLNYSYSQMTLFLTVNIMSFGLFLFLNVIKERMKITVNGVSKRTHNKLGVIFANILSGINLSIERFTNKLRRTVNSLLFLNKDMMILIYLFFFLLIASYKYGMMLATSNSYTINEREYIYNSMPIKGYFIGSKDEILYFSVGGKIYMISDSFEMKQKW